MVKNLIMGYSETDWLQISVSKSEKKLRWMANPSNVTWSDELISFKQTKDSECEGFRVEQFLCSA